MHLTRVENSDTKRVSLFWHTRYVVATRCEDPKLIILLTTFEIVNVMDRQMDGQTDDLRWQYRALYYLHRAVKMRVTNARVAGELKQR